MIQRPKRGETDEDLLRQEEEFLARANSRPAATVVSVNKRKTEEEDEKKTEPQKPQSKFARERANKKKKEGIVDNTVLKEAASREERVAVLGRIVERVVPPNVSLEDWKPEANPHGFPKAHQLSNLKHGTLSSDPNLLTGSRKKSLYMQELEGKGAIKKQGNQEAGASPSATPVVSSSNVEDPRISALGQQSYIIQGDISEAQKIHNENISKIASMSHDERLKAQQELMASLGPKELNFLQSLRKKKEMLKLQQTESEPMDCEASGKARTKPLASPTPPSSAYKGEELRKVRFSEDVEMETEGTSTSSVPDDSTINENELPIPPSEAKKWIHMDKVDLEKLKWMTDMPKPKPLKNNEGFVARFNFDGDILPYDADVSYREALHHHGEEPGRAGYTLDELFILIRSKVLQQRHIGLRTLANILRNAKEGLYDTAVNPPIIQLMVEAGVVLLLRFALDESSHHVYGEAVRGLYYLLSSEPDEHCLAMAQPWAPAGLEPGVSSNIHASEKSRKELDEEEKELKDIEVIKLDVIRALIRMDTHIRLRYILETVKPNPDTVIYTLGIMTRVVRHSLTAAWKLVQTPRLLSVILDNFLPHNLSPLLTGENVSSMSSVYGVPLKQALRLLRVLAARGRQLAAVLVNTHDVMGRILTYVSLEPSEVGIPLQEALSLSQEAYATWATLLAYGLSKAEEAIANFYPLIVKQLVFYRDKVPINEETEKNKFNYDVGAQLINTLTRAVNVAASQSLLSSRMKLNQGTVIGASGKAEVLPPPSLSWDDLSDIPQLIETCLKKWLVQLERSGQTSFSALRLLGSCCSFLDAYYLKWKDQSSYSGEMCNQKLQKLHDEVILPFLNSTCFSNLVSSLSKHSSFICDYQVGTKRDPVNLGSLGCVTHGGKIVPVVQITSPFPLLLPLSSLLVILHSLHPFLDAQGTKFLNLRELSSYFQKVCCSHQQLSEHWLTRVEVHMISNLLHLAALKGCTETSIFHETAMCIMACIQKGDEHLIEKLLSNVICSPEFTSDLSEMSSQVDNLALNDYEPLISPAKVQPILSPRQLTERISSSLVSICSELVGTLASKREYEASKILRNGIHFATNGITIDQTETPLALGKCWPLEPIKYVYKTSRIQPLPQKTDDLPKKFSSDQSSPEDILTVTRCLQMAYLGIKYRRRSILQSADISSWLQHLSLVFLVASDIFLDADVGSYLQGTVIELLRNGGYSELDPKLTIEGFNSSISWYKELLEQFLAVSYGDSTFALFLLIPVQQYWPIEYRKELWGDMSDALTFFRLTPKQVEQFIPLKQFFEPREEDEGLIIKYRSNLGSGNVSEARNSFLFTVASHHIRSHIKRGQT